MRTARTGARCMGSFELPMHPPLSFDQRPAATFGAAGAPAHAPTDARSMWGLHPGPTIAEPRLLMDVIDADNECAHGWLPTETCADCDRARTSTLVPPAPARTSTLVRPTVPRPLPRWLPAITRRALPAPDPVRPLIAAAAAATPDLIEIFRRAQPVTPVRRKRRAMPNTPKPVPGGPRPRTAFVEGLLRQIDDEMARLQHARDAITSVESS